MHAHPRAHTRAQALPLRTPQHALRGLAALAAAALAALGLTLAAASPALAHDVLVGYTVEANADSGAAEAVVLSFNNEVLPAGQEINLTGPDGSDATAGAPVTEGRDVTQPLAAPLAPGEYDFVWRVVSSDGHPIQGVLALSISDDGSGTLTEVGEEQEQDHDHGDHDHGDHEHGDHDHGDEHEDHADAPATPISAETADAETQDSSFGTIALVVVVALAAAAAVAAVIVGTTRRKRATGTENGTESGADR